jgi:hypothetical protein
MSNSPEMTLRVVGDGGRRVSRLSLPGLLVAGAIVVVGLLITGAVTGLIDLGNPFGNTTVDKSQPALLKKLRNLSEYRAASAELLVPIRVEKHVDWVPDFLAGESVSFDARGHVDATVDFARLNRGALDLRDDGSVSITLPHAELGAPVLDHQRSRVVDRDRGLLPRLGSPFVDNPTSEQDLYRRAERKMTIAARDTQVRARAEQNTEEMLRGLLKGLGFDRVEITFGKPQVTTTPGVSKSHAVSQAA